MNISKYSAFDTHLVVAVFRYGSVIYFQTVSIESKNTSWQRAEHDCKAYTLTLLSATGDDFGSLLNIN